MNSTLTQLLRPGGGITMNNTLIRLLKLAAPIRGWMALAALVGSLTVASGIGLMATSAYLISAAALHPSVAALQVAIVGVRFFGIARGVFRYLERMVSHRATFRLLSNLRVWFYTALEPLMPARLLTDKDGRVEGLRSGDLLRRVVADIDVLQNFYIRIVAPPVVAVIIGLGMWALLGAFGGIFALIYCICFLLASIAVPLLTHLLSKRLGQELVETRAELHTQLVDRIQGLADLVAFGQEEQQAQELAMLNTRLNRMQMAMAQISGLQGSLSNFLMNLTAWAMLLAAIPIISTGHLNGVFLAVIVLSTLASFEILLPLPGAFQQLGGSLTAAQRLFTIVDAPPAIQDPITPSPQPTGHTFEIKQLGFRYEATEPEVLKNITLTLPEGQCLAIIGPSGSGKSTLTRLLLRFWDYQEGQILLGGHELKAYQQEDLYRMISVVEQDTHLFNTTIRENLLIARSDATEEELILACQQAQLHDFVQTLPSGYHTQVGEQGLRLSGGERQRVAIARAFLKNAPILFLDEPTVNLDAVTERAILQALRVLCQGRTTLMIAHRLTELDMADEIVVLQNGQIIERGKQEQLLNAHGLYWQMHQQQYTTLRKLDDSTNKKVS
ncbi:thiol reductant ABC exporter subunit CydC [Tengunoibacter tsumagoiensis]|uniref:Thiol reductant ABC exporter subunit CydC n=1 Tax=Tengunoibacter tsumagoiensis TaxID=2014871 RepID=A0A401ZVQ0_9CHLR|nr:thiol reductant ABC exporter subunit CydC [Tengunoibacter tsumagoiensis]GCE10973.1 thiol reductant ABC exporter subunit CydC [Tengunoibacter tsumagoiensis]